MAALALLAGAVVALVVLVVLELLLLLLPQPASARTVSRGSPTRARSLLIGSSSIG
jgi:hypothetical protein